jgi:hypothetical protein
MAKTRLIVLAVFILMAMILSGCSPDERLYEMAQESLDRQAEQNQVIADQSKQVSETTDNLVDADAQARKEFAELQRETQAAISVERQSIDRQREELRKERRAVELDRRRAPVIAAAVTQVGLVIGCLAPLALAAYLLYVLRHSSAEDEVVTQILIEEVMADQPRLLLGRADVSETPALPSAERGSDSGAEAPLPF